MKKHFENEKESIMNLVKSECSSILNEAYDLFTNKEKISNNDRGYRNNNKFEDFKF